MAAAGRLRVPVAAGCRPRGAGEPRQPDTAGVRLAAGRFPAVRRRRGGRRGGLRAAGPPSRAVARDLHDVIAHHIALLNVQAGVASQLLRSDPDQADAVLGQMRDAGRTVLEELASVLYVLRQPGDDEQPTEPVPDLSRL